MTGLDLLKSRTLKNKVDVDSIAVSFEIKIPSLLRVFIESFQWNSELVEGKIFYYYPELAGGELSFQFNSIEDCLRSTIGSSDEDVIDRKLVLFATNRYGFYVGTIGDDADKVFTRTKSTARSFKVVADNVFEFLRGVTDNLSDVADTEKEYRSFMIAMGYEDEDLEQEIADWKVYKGFKN